MIADISHGYFFPLENKVIPVISQRCAPVYRPKAEAELPSLPRNQGPLFPLLVSRWDGRALEAPCPGLGSATDSLDDSGTQFTHVGSGGWAGVQGGKVGGD